MITSYKIKPTVILLGKYIFDNFDNVREQWYTDIILTGTGSDAEISLTVTDINGKY